MVWGEDLDASRLLHLRIPYGAEQNEGAFGQYVTTTNLDNMDDPEGQIIDNLLLPGAEAADESVLVTLRVFGANDTFLGEMPLIDGVLLSKKLTGRDTPQVQIYSVDNAGNVSDAETLMVEYVMTLGERDSNASQNST